MVHEKQYNIRAFFCMGRHRNVESFYHCPTYARIPKRLVRNNANLLVLFKQDKMILKHIYNDHENTDMTFTKLIDLCGAYSSNAKYRLMIIDKDDQNNNGRYRKGFDF